MVQSCNAEAIASYADLLAGQQAEAALIYMPGSGAGLGSAARAHGRYLLDFDPLDSWLLGILTPQGPQQSQSLAACATPNYFLAAHAARHRPDLRVQYVPAVQFSGWLAAQLGGRQRLGLIGGGEMPAWLQQAAQAALPGATWLALDQAAHRQRQQKTPRDLARHAAAAGLVDALFAAVPGLLGAPNSASAPLSAPQLQEMIRRTAWDLGCADCRSWISFGPQGNDADILAPDPAQSAARADIITVGLMLTLDGAFGHAIRSFCRGRPAAGLLAAHDALKAASDHLFAGLRPGPHAASRIARLEAEAGTELAARGFSQGFAFRLGHALGYAYEDPPLAALFQQPFDARQGAAPLADETILAPSLFELHPSLHLPGQGLIALGDMLLVEPGANRWLLTTPRDLLPL
ncbi:M24 family metallopeptidase [Ferrovibrio sp.]|uniref:M24 family metallopeptidase n=1 Tax=Ferrovibrio sp. TaxID=1917215 RepID=UPI0025B91DB9|nr:M24 family metallopeptidase [Ferrovibrio sp.]